VTANERLTLHGERRERGSFAAMSTNGSRVPRDVSRINDTPASIYQLAATSTDHPSAISCISSAATVVDLGVAQCHESAHSDSSVANVGT
jgi:hypothetical protein